MTSGASAAQAEYLEWSRAYTGRVARADAQALGARAPELARRLRDGMAAGEIDRKSVV